MAEATFDDLADAVVKLERDVRRLRAALLGAVLIGVAGALAAAAAPAGDGTFDRLDVHRLNIVEPDGTLRAVLTSDARTPGPIFDGREGTRNFPFSGLIIYNGEGNEIGGYGSGAGPGGEVMMNTMDFGRSEALASYRRYDADGRGTVGIMLNDQPPIDMPSREASQIDWSGIRLTNGPDGAEFVMNNNARKPRIRMVVGQDDRAAIEFLSADGVVVQTIGPSAR